MIRILLLCVIPVAGVLICNGGPPMSIFALPSISPCRTENHVRGFMETRTPNVERYLTNATLVSLKVCVAEATYYFFGSQVCTVTCNFRKITLEQAKGIAHGFCPSDKFQGHHIKFNPSADRDPVCVYKWPGTTHTVTHHCEKISGSATYHHGGEVHSTLAATIKCNYTSGSCPTAHQGWLLWDIDERSKHNYTHSTSIEAFCDGNRVWFPRQNLGFGLLSYGCNWTGFINTIEGVELKWVNVTKGRERRDVSGLQKLVTFSQLASTSEYLLNIITQKGGTLCETMVGVVPASNLIPHAHPSLYARSLLNKTNIIARTHGTLLFVWGCSELPASSRDSPTCHQHPRIAVDGMKPGFLGRDNNYLETSPQVDCNFHFLPYQLAGKAYIEIGGFHRVLDISTVPKHMDSYEIPALDPNFTNILPGVDLDAIVSSLQMSTSSIVNHIRSTGGKIGGQGGGIYATALPGLDFGWVKNLVHTMSLIGTIGGISFLLSVVCKKRTGEKFALLPAERPSPKTG